MAAAYAPFSNGGFKARAWGISRIRTAGGKVLYDHNLEKRGRQTVIGSPALPYMNQMMRKVVTSGTGTGARVPGFDIAGKTGTTSDYRDAWFVGYTGGFVVAVWTGKDDNTPMRRVTGGVLPAEIWRRFMVTAHAQLPARDFDWLLPDPVPEAGETDFTTGVDSPERAVEERGDFYDQLAGRFGSPRGGVVEQRGPGEGEGEAPAEGEEPPM
jgi:penicillin-binding protein 1A